MVQRLTIDQIHPDRLYALAEAAALIPSPRGGHLLPESLRERIRRKQCRGEFTRCGRTRHWFVRGAEIIRMAKTEAVDDGVELLESPAQRDRDHEKTLERMRAEGFSV